MFKNHAMQVRFVREPYAATFPQRPEPVTWTPDVIDALISNQIQNLIFSAGLAYVAKVAADTIGTVIVKKTKSR